MILDALVYIYALNLLNWQKMFTCKHKGTFCVLYFHACQKEEKKKEMILYKCDEKTNKCEDTE